jgi:hypothetical protein
MVVNPSIPAKTVPEFIAYAKANSGKVPKFAVEAGNYARLEQKCGAAPENRTYCFSKAWVVNRTPRRVGSRSCVLF